ncbi:MAG: primosomal protein N' [Nitrospinae bacterium]|nr:primosomal protein N' [Nitrospinota bacterium]
MSSKLTASVAVFRPVRGLYSYSFANIPREKLQPGVRVVVPFGRREEAGVFIKFADSDMETKEIKAVLDDKPIFPKKLLELALWCADYYMASPGDVLRMISPRESLNKKTVYKKISDAPDEKGKRAMSAENRAVLDALKGELSQQVLMEKTGLSAKELDKIAKRLKKRGCVEITEEYYFIKPKAKGAATDGTTREKEKPPPVVWTERQKEAIEKISARIEARDGSTTLLHGVTGSGKTEVFMALCEKALADGGGAIVLVPEIAITYQFVRRFKSRFGDKTAVLHSGLTPAQRRVEWTRTSDGSARLVIGARSAIFAPMADPRLVVVDEEHDGSYKQGEYPYYNARDVAVVLGKLTGAAVVLGSATPSVETYFNAQNGKYSICAMPERIDHRPMPTITWAKADEEQQNPMPTSALEKISEKLAKGEQALVFINRRGASASAKCKVCGEIAMCPNCSISLTHHSAGGKLMCHYCGYEIPIHKCPSCKSGSLFGFRGVGTQKVEAVLKDFFPRARIARLDHDTAGTREKTFAILERFEKGEADILVGTQMTAKGHDFPNLTFTAIVGADDYLLMPDFRSGERAFSLVTQAAGRTGRGDKPGEVIISTKGGDNAILSAANNDYAGFFKHEIENRRKTGFPPFSRLVGIMFESASQTGLEKTMMKLAESMPKMPAGVSALGLVPALVYKVRNRYRWKMLLKGKSPGAMRSAATAVQNAVEASVSASIDVDPHGFF